MGRWGDSLDMVDVSARGVILLAISLYFIAFVLPDALTEFFNASTAGWSAAVAAIWDILPLAVIALLVLKFVPKEGAGE